MNLSEREKEILSLSALSSRQIAKRLNISWRTVQSHFERMKEKSETTGKTALLIWALKRGEIQLNDIYGC